MACQGGPIGSNNIFYFLKNGPILAFLVYFRPFSITILIIQIEKSVDGVLGIQTLGGRMVDTDKIPQSYGGRPKPTKFMEHLHLLTCNVGDLFVLLISGKGFLESSSVH